jgi:hypothetical protein
MSNREKDGVLLSELAHVLRADFDFSNKIKMRTVET